jgi:hypothetical protein
MQVAKMPGYMPENVLRTSINENVWGFTELIKWSMFFTNFIVLTHINPIVKYKIFM